MNNLDYLEDIAALHEPTLDVGEGIYWTLNIEAYCQEDV